MSTSTATPTASTTTAPTAAPSNNLTNTNGQSFILFSNDWLKLQSIVSSILALPIDQGSFTTKYGTFSDQTEVTNCLASMTTMQGLGAQMGNPTALLAKIAQDPGYVSGPTAPPEIYAQCIWLAGQLMTAASTFQFTWASLGNIFAAGNTPAQNAAALREILTGTGGLQSTAQQMLGYTQNLQKLLGSFQTAYDAAQTEFLTYCNSSSKILQDAQAIATLDATDISDLQSAAATAHKEWEDYTIAAVTVSVGIMVLSGGLLWPIAAAAAGALGYEATREMGIYNADMAQIASDTTDENQKNQLVLDLTGLNNLLPSAQAAMASFATDLATIEGVWLDQNQQLTVIADLDDDTLGNLPIITKKIDLLHAQSEWQTIANTTSAFVTNSLVTYSTTTQFPNPIPTN